MYTKYYSAGSRAPNRFKSLSDNSRSVRCFIWAARTENIQMNANQGHESFFTQR